MYRSVKFIILVLATMLPLFELAYLATEVDESLKRALSSSVFAFLVLDLALSYFLVKFSQKPSYKANYKEYLFNIVILALSLKSLVFLSLLWITFFPGLRELVSTTLKSINSIVYVTILLSLHFYIYAVLGVSLFSETDPIHFGKIENSLVALFQVLTLEDWTDVMFAQITNPAEITAIPILFFISFVLIGTILILNLLVAIVTNAFVSAKLELEMNSLKAENKKSFEMLSNSIESLSKNLSKNLSNKLEPAESMPSLRVINGGLT